MLARGFSSALAGGFAKPENIAGPAVEVPAAWPALGDSGARVCPLVAQVLLARGAAVVFDGNDGRAWIDDSILTGPAGNPFVFGQESALDIWVSINRARVLREIELSAAMSAEKRAVWVTTKREKLTRYAARVLAAAARIAPGNAQAALIQEAEFAAVKWAHYA